MRVSGPCLMSRTFQQYCSGCVVVFVWMMFSSSLLLQHVSSSALYSSGYASLGASCRLNGGAECQQQLSSSTSCSQCAVMPFFSSTTTTTTTTTGCIKSCSGERHVLLMMRNGSVVGFGPHALLGQGDSSVASTSCLAPESGGIIVVASNATDISCLGNMSLVLLINGSSLFFGQTTTTGVAHENETFFAAPTNVDRLLFGAGAGQPSSVVVSQHVGLGIDAMVFILTNGSMITTGRGSLSGIASDQTNSWWRLVELPCPSSSVSSLSVGAQHALVLCSNGSVVGFGDNSFGQLVASQDTFNVDAPQFMTFDVSSAALANDMTIRGTHIAAGYAHSLVVVESTSLVNSSSPSAQILLGAGDNGNNALGFDSGTSSIVYGFTVLDTSVITSIGKMTKIFSGRQTSAILVERLSGSHTREVSNLFLAGNNQNCVLGGTALVAEDSALNEWALLPLDPVRVYNVSHLHLSFSRRLLMIAAEHPTMTLSRTRQSTTRSFATQSLASGVVRPSTSLSISRPVVSGTNSSTEEMSSTLTDADPSHSAFLSLSPTPQPGPRLTQALWVATGRLLQIAFDSSTNTPTTVVGDLLTISGAAQTFGEPSKCVGSWPKETEFEVVFASDSIVNITPFVGVIALRTDVVTLRRAGGFSLAAEGGGHNASSVVVSTGSVPEKVALRFGSQSSITTTAVGIGVGIFGGFVLILTLVICLRSARQQQQLSVADTDPPTMTRSDRHRGHSPVRYSSPSRLYLPPPTEPHATAVGGHQQEAPGQYVWTTPTAVRTQGGAAPSSWR